MIIRYLNFLHNFYMFDIEIKFVLIQLRMQSVWNVGCSDLLVAYYLMLRMRQYFPRIIRNVASEQHVAAEYTIFINFNLNLVNMTEFLKS